MSLSLREAGLVQPLPGDPRPVPQLLIWSPLTWRLAALPRVGVGRLQARRMALSLQPRDEFPRPQPGSEWLDKTVE
jgi:hypothetical protein